MSDKPYDWNDAHGLMAARIAELEQRLGEATGRIETDARLIAEAQTERLVLHDKLNAQARELGGERIDAHTRIIELEAERDEWEKACMTWKATWEAAVFTEFESVDQSDRIAALKAERDALLAAAVGVVQGYRNFLVIDHQLATLSHAVDAIRARPAP